MMNTYSAIIATTPNAIMYSVLLASPSIVSISKAGVTPPVAPTTALLAMKIGIIFCCNRNVTRVLARRLHARSDTARIEIFIHR